MKVKIKSKQELKPYVQPVLSGDFNETNYYAVNLNNGELIPTVKSIAELPSGIIVYGVDWDDYEQEYLVTDHDRPINNKLFTQLRELFSEIEV